MSIDPIEELIVARYLVSPTGRFRHMDDLRAWAQSESRALRRKIKEATG